MNTVKKNFAPLKTLQRQVRELASHRAQVGLFRETALRKGRFHHNPSLGYEHEFGNPKHNLPERSWLKMPLMMHLGTQISAKAQSWLYILRTRGAKGTLVVLGNLAKDLIEEAFATGGWGQWPELKRATVLRKKSSRILIESSQMRKAVAYRVI